MNVPRELLEKAKTAKTAEELLELAKAENIELTADEAAKYFADLHKSGELSDEELDNVAGGCSGPTLSPSGQASNPAEVRYLYPVGKYVEIISGCNILPSYESFRAGSSTYAANIVDRKIELYTGDNHYYPKYKVRYRSDQSEEWVWQNLIED